MADERRTEYGKGSKVRAEEHMEGLQAGSKSGGENSGPTGSSRHYPKKLGFHPTNTDWNPMELEPSTYGICGVGKD